MCSLRLENNLLTIEGVRFVSISKKTPLSKPSFAFVSLALPLLLVAVQCWAIRHPEAGVLKKLSLAGLAQPSRLRYS